MMACSELIKTEFPHIDDDLKRYVEGTIKCNRFYNNYYIYENN